MSQEGMNITWHVGAGKGDGRTLITRVQDNWEPACKYSKPGTARTDAN